ncbi:MAG: tandem-95 repeat protein, partial [Rhodobacteraceae bacterium]|nr:tandem-95 repeat protein [Paracoccaceae bacterium]
EIAGDFAATGQGRTGRNVQGGGDVNGDGIDDLVVGVGWAFHETGEVAERAYVIYGQQGGFGEIFYLADIDGDNGTVFTLDIPEGYVIPYTGPNANIQDDFVNYLGAVSIDIVADINNDRLDDIVIGTFTRERTVIHNPDDHFDSSDVTETTGKTFVLYGDQGGYGTSFDLNTLASGEGFIVDGVAYDGSGRVATSAGDINGDGGGDIFLGATNAPSLILFGDPFMNLPVTGSVLITGLAKEGETLTSEFNTIDDGDGVGELQLQWLRDGGAIAENGDGLDYTLTNADVGKTISLEVSFIDDSGTLEKVTSAETLLVENVNDLPVAVDDIANGDEDDPLIINVLANDTDEDISDTLFVSAVTQGESGAVVANADGTVTYTPDQEFSGVDSFTYTASDGNGGSSTANVDVTIDIVNDAPIAGEDSITLDEDGTDTVSVLDNDSDVDSASFELIGTTDGAKVTVTHLGNGLIEVTGKENAIGTDSFTYTLRDSGGATSTGTVQVTLNPVNDVPTPQDDLSSWTEDRTLIVNVIDNDTDPDGDTLTVVGVEDGQFTTAILNDDQTITVIPDPDFAGTDFVTYTVRDPGGLEQTAELKVIFTPIPDEPVAVDDDVVVVEDTPLNINVLSNDYDVDGTTPTIIFDNVQYIDPKHGSVAYVDDATLRYTPDQDYVGDDYFQYSITDELGYDAYATVTITVTPENDDPVAVEDLVFVQQESSLTFDPLVNDSDVENDALTITGVTDPSSGTVTIGQDGKSLSYSPKAGFKGNDSFDYTVSDGNGGENSATIDVIVLQNDPPVAVGDTITLLEDTPITFSPMINDTDLDGDSFNIQSVGTATFGALTNNGDGTLTYTPNANVNGDALEMVDYTIVDEFGRTSTAQITFNVTPVDDPTTGELLIKSTIDSFGNPFYEVDDSQLRDVEGIPGLFIQPTEPGGVGGFSGGNLFFEWIWKTASGVQIESGPWFDPFDDQYFGTTVTVEGTLTDGDGNTSFVKSAATAAIPRVWPIYFDPASPEIDIFIIFNEQYDPDNADPTRVLIDNFDINADEISFDKIPRDIALQAIRNAELGSAILSFEDGSTLVVEGEGVTPETLTVDHFILEDGNVDPTGTVIINGTAQAGQTLLADAAAVLDLDGITVATIAYQWQRDGSDIIGATAEGYLLTEGDVGADIRVVYSFTDDFGTDESVTSATIGPIAVDPTTVGESIFGTDNPEVLIGTSGGDTIFALSGDDVINAGAGNDTINGGEGFDRAIFSGNQLSYTVTITPTGTTITDRRVGGDGMDLLDSVELLDFETELSVFGNSPMNLDIFDGPATLNATEFAAITELYIAYFNRAPDAIGLYFWASVYADGFSLANMAVEFFKQPETKLTYAASLDDLGENLTDISTFVSSVYSNVLGRSFDEEGRDFWVGVLERQDVTPASFISEIIKGAKAAAGPDASQEFIDQKAADVAYLETKVDIGAYFAVLKGMSEVNNARAVMELYDGSAQSVQNTVAEIDSIFAEALDAENGEFLMQLIGVIDDPFSVA